MKIVKAGKPQKQVRIECQGAAVTSLDTLIPLQGNLKSLSDDNYKKLRDEIVRDGFSEPISVWKKTRRAKGVQENSFYVLNGHMRLIALKKMRDEEEYAIPALPVSFVEAPDEKAAKRKILALTSQYGEMTQTGLFEFVKIAEIDLPSLKDFRFPEINIDNFAERFAPTKKKVTFEATVSNEEEKKEEFAHECPRCGYGWNPTP